MRAAHSGRVGGTALRWWAVVFAAVCLAAVCARASVGDQAPEFRNCVESCFSDLCGPDGVNDGITGRPERHSKRLPWSLRLTRWTCREDCEYHCTHQLTNEAQVRVQMVRNEVRQQLASDAGDAHAPSDTLVTRASQQREEDLVAARLATLPDIRKRMVQFYGKWPFVRILGAQEPLSVLFSLSNLLVQVHVLLAMRSRVSDAFPLKANYLFHTLVSVNAWIWSAVFHIRDRPWTGKLNYFSAGAMVFHLTFLTLARFWRLSPRPSSDLFRVLPPAPVSAAEATITPSQEWFHRLQMGFLAAYFLHIIYLSRGKFDYQFNVTVNIVALFVQLGVQAVYAVRPSVFPGGWSGEAAHHRIQSAPAPEVLHLEPIHDRVLNESEQIELTPRPLPLDLHRPATSTSASHSVPRASNTHRRQLSLQALLESQSSQPMSPPDLLNSPPPLSVQTCSAHTAILPLAQRRRSLLLLVVGMVLCASLKICDFPPIGRALDAHALWLLSIIPLSWAWYNWLIEDARALTLRAGGLDPSVRPMTPDPYCRAHGLPNIGDDDDEPWVGTDVWASFSAYRTANAPWWTSHAYLTPRWVRSLGVLSSIGYNHASSAGQTTWRATQPIRRKGLISILLQLVDGVTDMLEVTVNKARSIGARP